MSTGLHIISYRQFTWLIAALLTGGGLLTVQHELIRVSKTDAWVSFFFPAVYALLVGYVLTMLAIRFPNKNMYEINTIVFGRLGGIVANLVLVIHFWSILMRDLRAFGKFIGTILLPNTPQEIVLLLFVSILIFYGRTSIEVVARVNELFFPVFFILMLILPLLLSNELNRTLIQPVLTINAQSLTSTSLLGTGWYGDILIAGAFMHTMWSSKQLRSSFRHGIMLSTFLLSIALLMAVLVLGPNIPGNIIYPNYSLVQHIHITDFLDRVDLIILSILFPVSVCKIIYIYLAFLLGISSLVKRREYALINTPAGLWLLLTTLIAFKTTTEVFSFGNYCSPVFILGYQPLLLIGLIALSRRFPSRGEMNEQDQGDTQTSGRRSNRSGLEVILDWFNRISYSTLLTTGNLLIVACAALLLIGMWLGPTFAIVGNICGVLYALCFTAVLLTTHLELKKASTYRVQSPRQFRQAVGNSEG
ncbi:endospore germination permease [Paenibacillus sp. YYML68]|uniref:GerAB/ArcD/ProY family transporter n=1 Tax=Paenibacillus sp. YYML68 TaxID=2909250 RepID=UPI00248F90A6|nr:endospore germination permease [Paenibacillus sp. YYML68]